MLNGQYLIQYHIPLGMYVTILVLMVEEICDARTFCDQALEEEESIEMKEEGVVVADEYALLFAVPTEYNN